MRKIQAVDKEELLKAKKELKEFQDESPVAALKAELQEIMVWVVMKSVNLNQFTYSKCSCLYAF